MRKSLLLLAVALALSIISSRAGFEATVIVNNYPPNKPIFYLTPGVPVPINIGAMVEILGGPPGGPLQPLQEAFGKPVTALPFFEPGLFDAGTLVVPGVQPSALAQFEVRAWVGSSYETASLRATTGPIVPAQPTGMEDPTLPGPFVGPLLNIPFSITIGLSAIPEPSTLALGVLGTVILLVIRRKSPSRGQPLNRSAAA